MKMRTVRPRVDTGVGCGVNPSGIGITVISVHDCHHDSHNQEF